MTWTTAAWRPDVRCSATPTWTGRRGAVTPFSADGQAVITRAAWGDVGNRPGLDRRTRIIVTLTALVALDDVLELALHTRRLHRGAAQQATGIIAEVLAEQ